MVSSGLLGMEVLVLSGARIIFDWSLLIACIGIVELYTI